MEDQENVFFDLRFDDLQQDICMDSILDEAELNLLFEVKAVEDASQAFSIDFDLLPPSAPVAVAMPAQVSPRPAIINKEAPVSEFAVLTQDQLNNLEAGKDEKRTKYATSWGVKRFKEWLKCRGFSEDFETLPTIELSERLRQFYAETRKKNGENYSKNALRGLRSSIHRYLTSPPFNRCVDIMQGIQFKRANNMMGGVLKHQKRQGQDKTQHHAVIHSEDLHKLMACGVLNTDTPGGLLKMVWFNIQFHLCRRGGEGLRDLRKDSFNFQVDARGVEYVQLSYYEATKNHPGDINTDEAVKKMFATGQTNCPVATLAKYLRKLNPQCKALYQRPRDFNKLKIDPAVESVWYTNCPMGVNKLRNLMKEISEEACLSQIYTNHCIRATCITHLTNSGFDNITIARLSGHRNPASVTSYCRDASEAQKEGMSSSLSSALGLPIAGFSAVPSPRAPTSQPPVMKPSTASTVPFAGTSSGRSQPPLALHPNQPSQPPLALDLSLQTFRPSSVPTQAQPHNGHAASTHNLAPRLAPRPSSELSCATRMSTVNTVPQQPPTLSLASRQDFQMASATGLFTNCNIGHINVYLAAIA